MQRKLKLSKFEFLLYKNKYLEIKKSTQNTKKYIPPKISKLT